MSYILWVLFLLLSVGVIGLGAIAYKLDKQLTQKRDQIDKAKENLTTFEEHLNSDRPIKGENIESQTEQLVDLVKVDYIVTDDIGTNGSIEKPRPPDEVISQVVSEYQEDDLADPATKVIDALATFRAADTTPEDAREQLREALDHLKRVNQTQDQIVAALEISEGTCLPDSNPEGNEFEELQNRLSDIKDELDRLNQTDLTNEVKKLVIEYRNVVKDYRAFYLAQQGSSLQLDAAATVQSEERLNSEEAESLMNALVHGQDNQDLVETLRETVKALDDRAQLMVKLSSADSAKKLKERSQTLLERLETVESPAASILDNQVESLKKQIHKKNLDLVDRYQFDNSLTLLENGVSELENHSEIEGDIATRIKIAEDRFDEFRDNYPNNRDRGHYDHSFATHFAGLVQELLNEAKSAARESEKPAAHAYVSAAESTIEYMEQMYKNRATKAALRQLGT